VDVNVEDDMVTRGDAGLLRVALENLVGNAWKFSRRTTDARIEVTTAAVGPDVAYVVRDNGAGFPSSEARRLFSPFHRLHEQDEFPGTGIGLTTVQRIVERHGGKIWADGEVGHGAVFTFTLPGLPD
jgi:signal transduction histidine kinase